MIFPEQEPWGAEPSWGEQGAFTQGQSGLQVDTGAAAQHFPPTIKWEGVGSGST